MARKRGNVEHSERDQVDKYTIERLQDVFRLSPVEVRSQLDGDLLRYYRHLFADPEKVRPFAAVVASFFAMAKWKRGCTILDVGCGFGLQAMCMRALGARRVVGLDVSEGKIRTARRIASMIKSDVEFIQGNTLLQFGDGTFDGILIKDALSHLTEDDPFIAEAARLLSPEGTLLIIDDRNALSPLVQWRTRRLWRISEFGNAVETARLALTSNYFSIRLKHLAKIAPDLPLKHRERIAYRSRGYTNEQLSQLVGSSPKGRRPPVRKAACIDPTNGVVQERLLNPLALRSKLSQLGFRAWIKPFSDRRIMAALWPLTLPLVASFCVVGEKPAIGQFTNIASRSSRHT